MYTITIYSLNFTNNTVIDIQQRILIQAYFYYFNCEDGLNSQTILIENNKFLPLTDSQGVVANNTIDTMFKFKFSAYRFPKFEPHNFIVKNNIFKNIEIKK